MTSRGSCYGRIGSPPAIVGPSRLSPRAMLLLTLTAAILAVGGAGPTVLLAADANAYWTAAAGNWSDANNWSAGEPNASLHARITNGGAAAISSAGKTVGDLTLGDAYGESGALTLVAGGLESFRSLSVGYHGTGLLTQSGGTDKIAGELVLGRFAGAWGTYQLLSGELAAGYQYVGDSERVTSARAAGPA